MAVDVLAVGVDIRGIHLDVVLGVEGLGAGLGEELVADHMDGVGDDLGDVDVGGAVADVA